MDKIFFMTLFFIKRSSLAFGQMYDIGPDIIIKMAAIFVPRMTDSQTSYQSF
jgi:hypothetical protein